MAKCEELQRQTLRVLADLGAPDKPLSARAAGEKLGIGYNQIADMVKGKPPAEKTLMKFASAIGEPPADWLHYGGRHDFAATLGAKDDAELTQEQKHALQIAHDLSRVPKERRGLLLRQIRALIRATESASTK